MSTNLRELLSHPQGRRGADILRQIVAVRGGTFKLFHRTLRVDAALAVFGAAHLKRMRPTIGNKYKFNRRSRAVYNVSQP